MKRLITILLLFGTLFASGQKDALYYQYMFNHLILNPAYAGVQKTLNVYMVDRYQWVGIPGAPNTITFSLDVPTRNQKVGLGMYIFNDRLGPLSNYGILGNYAYRVKAWEGTLSFGLQAGIVNRWINWDIIEMDNMNDIYLITRPQARLSPDVNFGVLYYNEKFFVGLSSKHLLEVTFNDIIVKGNQPFNYLKRHF